MPTYRVEIAYATRRACVATKMVIEAADEDDARAEGRRLVLKGRPARKFVYAAVEEQQEMSA